MLSDALDLHGRQLLFARYVALPQDLLSYCVILSLLLRKSHEVGVDSFYVGRTKITVTTNTVLPNVNLPRWISDFVDLFQLYYSLVI